MVKYRPERWSANATSWVRSSLGSRTATWSPGRSPWANRAWARRLERSSSWANVTTRPDDVITAGRSPSLAA